MHGTAPTPIEKHVVLVGAGNAHLQFVKRCGMQPIPGVSVTLVNPDGVIPYSAMVPGHLGGEYTRDEATIDLVRLCSGVGVRLIREAVVRIEPGLQRIHFAERVPMTYDALSLGLGSLPAAPGEGGDNHPFQLAMRPMGRLVEQIEALETRLLRGDPVHLVVVGGGASGCELTLALHKRLSRHAGFRLSLLQGGAELVPNFPARTARLLRAALTARGIALRVNARVTGTGPGCLLLAGTERFSCEAVLWATDASPPRVLGASGLDVDAAGFLRVRPTLQSVSHSEVFGTGDCVAFDAYPNLPRNGVHAVRQGAILFDNVVAFLHERPLAPYRPQSVWLALLNTSDGSAIFGYGPLAIQTRWARRLKDRIDRRWMAMFAPRPMQPTVEDEYLMRCGGCGAKISGDVLGTVIKRLDIPGHPRVLVGCADGEDAAVLATGNTADTDTVEVQTVDYFKAFVDDPYLFGRVAALHAVSDLYAMNASPFAALAVATLPYARGPVQEAQLFELLSGATLELRRLGIALAGGHTSEGRELALGFSVTGRAERARLFRKGGLRPDDVLILTKPLGCGALLAAWMRGQCRAAWFEELTRGMLVPNRDAGAVFAAGGVHACTDVTGFGLAGHLLEMLDASGVAAELDASAIPLYAGFAEVVSAGLVSTLHLDNGKVAGRIERNNPPAWLFDPQTSGGLLAGVAPEHAAETLRQLHAVGLPRACIIGRIVPGRPGIRV